MSDTDVEHTKTAVLTVWSWARATAAKVRAETAEAKRILKKRGCGKGETTICARVKRKPGRKVEGEVRRREGRLSAWFYSACVREWARLTAGRRAMSGMEETPGVKQRRLEIIEAVR